MVSIHIVPVIVYLIIRVISCIFRFKRGNCLVYLIKGIAKHLTENKQPTHAKPYIFEQYITASERLYRLSFQFLKLAISLSRIKTKTLL